MKYAYGKKSVSPRVHPFVCLPRPLGAAPAAACHWQDVNKDDMLAELLPYSATVLHCCCAAVNLITL